MRTGICQNKYITERSEDPWFPDTYFWNWYSHVWFLDKADVRREKEPGIYVLTGTTFGK